MSYPFIRTRASYIWVLGTVKVLVQNKELQLLIKMLSKEQKTGKDSSVFHLRIHGFYRLYAEQVLVLVNAADYVVPAQTDGSLFQVPSSLLGG